MEPNNQPAQGDIMSKSAYALISLVGLLISIALAYFYFTSAATINFGDNLDKAYYILLVVFAVSINAFLFGAMASYAAFNGSVPGRTIKLRGPVVGVCLIVAGGFLLPRIGGGNSVSIRVYDENHEPVTSGEVRLNMKNIMRQPINRNGEALFSDLSSDVDSVAGEIMSDGFEKDVFMIKPTGRFSAFERTLLKKTLIVLEGNITDADYRPVVNATVSVDNTPYSTNTLSDGHYKLEVHNIKIGEDVVLSVFHPDYTSRELPVQIIGERTTKDIMLSPVVP